MFLKKLKEDIPFTLGFSAAFFYAIHSVVLMWEHQPYNLLWACSLGCWFIGVGLMFRLEFPFFVGMFWLILGTPIWLMNVIYSGEFMITSAITNIGGLAIAFLGLRYLKVKKFSWAVAMGALIFLGVICRFFTPSFSNVNLSHGIWKGWEHIFPSHALYLLTIIVIGTATFFVCELFVRFLETKREFSGIGKKLN